MGLFKKKTDLTLLDQVLELKKRVSILENENIDILAGQKAMRDKILKRFQGKKDKNSEENESLYNNMLIPEG